MSAITLQASDRFPVGTSVGAYTRAAWPGASTSNPDAAAPSGAAVETQNVAADGSLTFTTLTDAVVYFAYAQVGGQHRLVRFVPGLKASGADLAEMKRQGLLPTGAIDETMPRVGNVSNIAGMLASGTLRLQAAVLVPKGRAVSSISLFSGSTAADTPLNQWFCLVRMSDLAVLAKTVDDTTAAWAANSRKTLALAAPLIPAQDELCYVGACVVATTPPSLMGNSLPSGVLDEAQRVCGPSTAGLTNPASLGAAAAAPSANTQQFYAYVS